MHCKDAATNASCQAPLLEPLSKEVKHGSVLELHAACV